MKLTNFKIVPFIIAGAALLALSGCDGTTGISSDGGLGGGPVTPPGTAPVAVNDNKPVTVTGAVNEAASVDVLANDTDAEDDINTTSIQIVGTTNPGDCWTVPNEGKWCVTNVDQVRFTPEAGFIGDPTPISYTVSDDTGLVSNEASVTIDYTQTYFENNTTYNIPDGIGIGTPGEVVLSEITATNAVTSISKVTVTVDITHTYDGDLAISLIGPLGKSIILSSNNGVDGQNYTNTTFDDAAATSITSASAPFTGTFQPEEPLDLFIDDNANGIWTLEVSDNGPTDVGTLNSWSITIE